MHARISRRKRGACHQLETHEQKNTKQDQAKTDPLDEIFFADPLSNWGSMHCSVKGVKGKKSMQSYPEDPTGLFMRKYIARKGSIRLVVFCFFSYVLELMASFMTGLESRFFVWNPLLTLAKNSIHG